jgi:CheY-like chemotaxis protein
MSTQPARVLVADDEPLVREFLRGLFTSEGYEVAVFETGAQLLEVVPTFHPDAVVVDMMMPGLSGTDVLAALSAGRPHHARHSHLGTSHH